MKIIYFNTALITLLAITTSFLVVGKNNLITDKTDSNNAWQLITLNHLQAVQMITKAQKTAPRQAILPAKVNLAEEQVTKKETVPPNKKNNDDRFIPTEAISEDLAVSFPVDI
ncbi:MAG: hypothetical protein HRT51_13425 [Colwellia sp.]|nr:hypothetical protein [Colwellia sp.]